MKKTVCALLVTILCSIVIAEEGRILKNGGMILNNGPIAITLNREASVSMQAMPKPHNVDKKYKDVARIEDVLLSDEQVNYIADKIVVTRNIPHEEDQRLKKRNPQIIFSKYSSSTYLKHWPLEEIERDYMQHLAMCPAAVLENDIDHSTTEFTVSHYTWPKTEITESYFDKVNVDIDALKKNAPEIRGYNDLIPIYASTIEEEAEFSEHGRKFVFFIRIAGELMRVNQWDKESGKLRVTRGYKGSRASHHDKGDVVTSPIYNAGGTPIVENGLNLFSKTQAAKLAKNRADKEPGLYYCSDKSAANIPILERRGQELVEYMQEGYDCANLDAMSATIPQFRMVNALTMKTGPWNFEKNRPYSVFEWVEGHDRMVGVMQRYAYAETGRWGEIIANGVSSANFQKGDGNGGYSKRLLVPTSLKSRPMVSYNTEKGSSACGSAFEDQLIMLQTAFQEHLAPSISFKAPHYAETQKAYDRNLNYCFAFLYLAFEPKPKGWELAKDGPGFIFRSSYFSPWFHLPSVGPEWTHPESGTVYKCGFPYPLFLPLGNPLTSAPAGDFDALRYEETNVFMRHYENGLVLLNPTSKSSKLSWKDDDAAIDIDLFADDNFDHPLNAERSYTIKLDRRYIDSETGDYVEGEITLGPGTGKMLLIEPSL